MTLLTANCTLSYLQQPLNEVREAQKKTLSQYETEAAQFQNQLTHLEKMMEVAGLVVVAADEAPRNDIESAVAAEGSQEPGLNDTGEGIPSQG